MKVKKDLANCMQCGVSFSVSDSMTINMDAAVFDTAQPPPRCCFTRRENGWTVAAAAGGWSFLFAILFMYSFAKMFTVGVYALTRNFAEEPDLLASNVGTLLFVLFFLSICVSMIIMLLAGKYVVSVEGTEGQVFIGVGPIGWRQKFDWRSIRSITEYRVLTHHRGRKPPAAYFEIGLNGMEGKKLAHFGMFLNSVRSYFMFQTLRRMLAERKLQDRQVIGN